MKLRATSDFPFNNKCRKRGDVFDESDDDAAKLVYMGVAEYAAAPKNYAHKELKAETPEENPRPHPHRNRYTRRDMRPEK